MNISNQKITGMIKKIRSFVLQIYNKWYKRVLIKGKVCLNQCLIARLLAHAWSTQAALNTLSRTIDWGMSLKAIFIFC